MLPSEEIKEKINIVDFVGEYVQLKKAGVNYRGLCPFHQEKTPSFTVSPTKQIWHCFGCGLGGDVFEFVKQIEGVEFPEALQILANRAGVVLKRPTVSYQKEADQKKALLEINELAAKFYAEVLDKSSLAAAAREYLAKRGLKPETIQTWGLGFAPDDFHVFENFIVKKGFQKKEAVAAGFLIQKEDGTFFDRFRGRIMFPLHDIHGRVVGFTARILVEQEGAGKYVNSPETAIYHKSRLIYGLHLAKSAIRQQNEVIAVEGNMDAITCHEAGFTNVVASSGTALTLTQLETLKRFTNSISFAFDIDEAGLLATRRAVELALSLGFNVRVISIPKSLAKDPDDLVRKDRLLWEERVKDAKNFMDFYFEGTFAKMSKELTNFEKKQAVASLLPLVSLLPEPIDRVHYVQKLADQIRVDEKVILDLLNQHFVKSRSNLAKRAEPGAGRGRVSRQELLEQRVLGLLLKFFQDFAEEWRDLRSEDFSSPVLREIFERVSGNTLSGDFDLQNFLDANPRLKPEVELLIFAAENELAFIGDLSLEDVGKSFLGEFKLEVLKRQMRELAGRIKTAEAIGRFGEAKTLSSEFNNLSQQLSKYVL